MAPIVHGLESEFFGKVGFVYLDVDDPGNDLFLKELGFRYQPHYFLLNGEGDIIQQWLGEVPESQFREALNAAIE